MVRWIAQGVVKSVYSIVRDSKANTWLSHMEYRRLDWFGVRTVRYIRLKVQYVERSTMNLFRHNYV
jgi:hypothetical protein